MNGKLYFFKENRTDDDVALAEQFFILADKAGNAAGSYNLGKLFLAKNYAGEAEDYFKKACLKGYKPPLDEPAEIKALWNRIEKKVQAERENAETQAKHAKYLAETKKFDSILNGRDAEAQFNLAMDYISKEEKDQNTDYWIRSLLEKATDKGHVNATRELANIHAVGVYGVPKNLAMATSLLETLYTRGENPELAKNSHLEETWRSFGTNSELRKSRRFALFQKEFATHGGGLLLDWANDYLLGQNSQTRNEVRAVEMFTFLDAKGYGLGTIALGKLHYYGQGGFSENKKRTKELFRRAQTLGITNPGLTGELLNVWNAEKNAVDASRQDFWEEAARRNQLN